MNDGAVRITIYLRDKAKATVAKLKTQFSGLQKHVKGAFAAMATAGRALRNVLFNIGTAAGALAFTVLVSQTLQAADGFAKMSRQIGVSVEDLTTLNYVAGRGGVGLQDLRVSLQALSRNANDASQGVGEAIGAFQALGVDVNDANGELKDTQQIVYDVADAFEGLKDGPAKTAAAMKIFGRSGATLIPILNDGSEGMKRLQGRARALGLEMSTGMAQAAEQANDNMADLMLTSKGFGITVTNLVLPSLVNITGRLANAAASGSFLNQVWAESVVAMTRFQQYVTGNEDGLKGQQRELEATAVALAELRAESKRLLEQEPLNTRYSRSSQLEMRQENAAKIRAVRRLQAEQQQRYELGLANAGRREQERILAERLATEARMKAKAARDAAMKTLQGFSNTGPGKPKSPEEKFVEDTTDADNVQRMLEEQTKLQELQELAAQNALQRLEENNASELELIKMRLDNEVNAVGDSEEAKAAIREFYSQKTRQQEARSAAARMQLQATLGNNLVGLAHAVGIKSHAVEKANAIAQAVLAFNVAKAKAVAAGTPWGAPARIAAIVGIMGPLIASLKGSAVGGAGAVGGGGVAFGGGGGGGGGFGVPDSAPVAGRQAQAGPGPGNVTIVVKGNLMSREYVQGELVNELREAARQGFNLGNIEVRAGRQ